MIGGQALIGTAKPRLLAAVRRQATRDTLAGLITGSGVWSPMGTRGIKSTGHNVVVYWDEPGRNLLDTPGGIPIDIGAEILEPFQGDDDLACAATPSGRFISLMHVGPYTQLGTAYQAIHAYCRAEGLTLAGPYWEFYGHWTENPEKLGTEVCCLLG